MATPTMVPVRLAVLGYPPLSDPLSTNSRDIHRRTPRASLTLFRLRPPRKLPRDNRLASLRLPVLSRMTMHHTAAARSALRPSTNFANQIRPSGRLWIRR